MKKGTQLMTRFMLIAFIAIGTVQCQSDKSEANNGTTEDPLKIENGLQESETTRLTPEEVEKLGLNDAGEQIPDLPLTTVEWSEEAFDFGNITEGDVAKHVFKFKNTGDEPMIIQSAKGSCGCTVPKYTDEPIAPGEEGEINVEFNSAGKPGSQSKSVTVVSNIEGGTKVLKISAEVAPKAQ